MAPLWAHINKHAYYSFINPGRMKGWVGLVGWPAADGLPTQWSPVGFRPSAGQGQFAGQRPAFCQLCYTTNLLYVNGDRSVGGVCTSAVPRLAAGEGRSERCGRLETCGTRVEADGISFTSYYSVLSVMDLNCHICNCTVYFWRCRVLASFANWLHSIHLFL